MAAGTIITVLANIPWGQVVENAPKVADGAAKLWNAVTRKKPGRSPDAKSTTVAGTGQSGSGEVTQRLVEMEAHILRLEEQMGASAELIKALAEQNALLVRKIDLNSRRLLRLATATAVSFLVLVASMIYLP